ncbi:hypothetical protein CBS9595_002681 [Malassezia furfur]|nr:hypothetical protein CBS9595_002681 [Malassezia furfur]
MFWRFGVAPVSTLTTLLEKPDITVEDVLNEPDLLQECKSNNHKLVAYLQQPEVLQRLLDYVIGAVEVEDVSDSANQEKIAFKYPYFASEVLSSEIPEISLVLFQNAQALLAPFWDNFLSTPSDAFERPIPLHAHPLTSATYVKSEAGNAGDENEEKKPEEKSTGETVKYSGRSHGPGHTVLAGYWSKVNMALLEKHPQEMLAFVQTLPTAVEGLVSHFETSSVVDLLFRLIQTEDSVPDAGIIQWFADNDLITRIVSLLSPHVSTEQHKAAAEFLKAIISLSAPSPSALNQITMQETFGGPGEMLMGAGGVNNLLVRELASEETVNKMTYFMLDFKPTFKPFASGSGSEGAASRKASMRGALDSSLPALRESLSSDESAVEEEDDDDDEEWQVRLSFKNRRMSLAQGINGGRSPAHRDSTATVRPSDLRRDSIVRQGPSQAAITSSFTNCAGVFIELIRKNNSDYFEQHLFHTLRNYLLLRQQEVSGKRQQERLAQKKAEGESDKPDLTLEDLPFEDDDDVEGMEEAMAEVAEKMGIVHLGPLLHILSSRIPDLQEMMKSPKLAVPFVSTTLGQIEPLTQTRYCIAELYAEMLHCSNMVLLNREPNVGPQYSPTGTLLGGIEGLQRLARALQGDDGGPLFDSNESNSNAAQPSMSQPELHVECEDDDAPPPTAPTTSVSSDRLAAPQPGSTSGHSSETESSDSEADQATDDEDAKSIASALSSMSLADLTAQFASRPPSVDDDHLYATAGDYLKKQFYDFQVVPTLIELFLNHPWNNFLHNVVYDIVQQLFNGDMDAGINKKLTIATFEQAGLIDAILEGSRRNQESSSQLRHIRLAFMGHLNLIAEEVIKLLEKYPAAVGEKVKNCFPQPYWDTFVNDELRVSRVKEAMPLAGGRPNAHTSNEQSWGKDSDNWYADSEGNNTFARYLSSQMRNESTEDEAQENDILAQLEERTIGSFPGDDPNAEEDEWGPFSDSNQPSDFNFISTGAIARAQTNASSSVQENLTPADWAAEFRRGGMGAIPADDAVDNDSDSDSAGSGRNRDDKDGTDSDDNGADDSPFVDLHKPATLRQRAQTSESLPTARSPEAMEEVIKNQSERWPAAEAGKHVRSLSGGSQDRAQDWALAQLPPDVEPTKDGLLRRKLSDGTSVTAPLDDAELMATESALDISDDEQSNS